MDLFSVAITSIIILFFKNVQSSLIYFLKYKLVFLKSFISFFTQRYNFVQGFCKNSDLVTKFSQTVRVSTEDLCDMSAE